MFVISTLAQGRVSDPNLSPSRTKSMTTPLLQDRLVNVIDLTDLTAHDSAEKTLAWAIILGGNPARIFGLDTRPTIYGCEVWL